MNELQRHLAYTLLHSSFFYIVLYVHHIEFHEFDVLNRAALLSLPVYIPYFAVQSHNA